MYSIGIIGGIGPESTINYYRGIISQYRKIKKDGNYPNIIINSIDMTKMLWYIEKEDYTNLIEYLINSIKLLEKCNVSFIAIGSNTPHIVFDELQKNINVPMISIVEETCNYAKKNNIKKVLLLGTKFTMKNPFYKNKLEDYGISVVVPDIENQNMVHNIIFPELEEGIVVPEKKQSLLKYINEIINIEKIEGVVLGCTELPIMINQTDLNITVLNTTQIHIDAIVKRLIK